MEEVIKNVFAERTNIFDLNFTAQQNQLPLTETRFLVSHVSAAKNIFIRLPPKNFNAFAVRITEPWLISSPVQFGVVGEHIQEDAVADTGFAANEDQPHQQVRHHDLSEVLIDQLQVHLCLQNVIRPDTLVAESGRDGLDSVQLRNHRIKIFKM